MRDYAKVGPKFWIGATGKKLRTAGMEAQIVALYLMTAPHANMLGLYYIPLAFIAHETGLPYEGAKKGLQCAIQAGFCEYDSNSEMVWVVEMARYQIADVLKDKDLRIKGVQNEYDSLPENPFLSRFYDMYCQAFCMSERRSVPPQFDENCKGPSKPLASQEQEQEQEHKQEHASCTEPQSVSPPAGDDQPGLVGLEDLPPTDLAGTLVAKPVAPVVLAKPVLMMPLVGDKEFGILQTSIDEWTGAYPAVDVIRQLAAMRQWCLANPTKRKTKRGVLSFCNAWLMREQDRPARPAAAVGTGGGGGAWWASDKSIIDKGAEFGISPFNGERMPDFKARVQGYIDNDGKAPPQRARAAPSVQPQDEPRRFKPAGLNLAGLVGVPPAQKVGT